MTTKKKNTDRRKRPAAKVRMQRRRAASHLLVLECQTEKLGQQKLDLGSRIVPVLRGLFPMKRIVFVGTSTTSELGQSLAAVWNANGRFRSILVVGHSNATGLQLTADQFFAWDAIGKWLEKFEPEFLFLAACDAGQSRAVRRLFAPIPSLREVYASPIKLYLGQTAPLVALIISVLQNRKVDDDVSHILQALNFVITRGQLYRWKRGEVGAGEELSGDLWDLVASILDKRV
jgi:hypothetical protein